MRPRVAAGAVAVLALSVSLAACSRNTGQSDGGAQQNGKQETGSIATDPKDSLGPAPAVPGATSGGTVYLLRQKNVSHLDPARQYTVAAMTIGQLYSRYLTTFREDGKGHLTLVGDLAETPGKDVKNDCTTWEFSLKKGLKFEDGSEIRAKDVAYGIARAFDLSLTGGPTYLQEWLADEQQYDKVWDFKAHRNELPPGLSMPSDHVVRFEFKHPHCDTPFAVSLPYTAPVPKDKDKGVDYDAGPVSSGPYKIAKYTKGVELVLERNPNWDAKSDAVRHQYPDRFHFQVGADSLTQTNRIIADSGPDQTAVMMATVPQEQASTVKGNAALQSRVVKNATPFTYYLHINNQKVTDLNVRRALNYAIDRENYLKVLGGDIAGTPATTLMSPQTIGWQSYDAYPAGRNGDQAKAKELLGGRTPELVLAHSDSKASVEQANQLKQNLDRMGFKITLVPVPDDAYFDKVGEKANAWDLYVTGWIADWPGGDSIIPELFDGRKIKAQNNHDYDYFTNADVSKEIDRVNNLPIDKQGAAWAALDKKIMTEYAPNVPLYFETHYAIVGSKVGGIYVSDVLGTVAFPNAYVKK